MRETIVVEHETPSGVDVLYNDITDMHKESTATLNRMSSILAELQATQMLLDLLTQMAGETVTTSGNGH